MIIPPPLRAGDKVAITCPAKKLPHPVPDAVALLESWGLEVVLGETVTASHYQFAGTDELRAADLQRFLDDSSVKAIIAARGGYGTLRVIDRLDFSRFREYPKWVAGFSDITVLHSHILATCGVATIHGQMPLNIPDATKPSLDTLRKALFGEPLSYCLPDNGSRPGIAEGELIGGNLTLLAMLSGSVSDTSYDGKILFIEDVGEYKYAIDRLMWQLRRSGKLAQLAGLIVGEFAATRDFDDPFGKTVEEIVLDAVADYSYPVCVNFPAGHISDNHAIVLGKRVSLKIDNQTVNVDFL
jgi:muramoyltetrapeptide carboxypeptidase